MSIDIWAASEFPYLELPQQAFGYALAALYTVVLLVWLARHAKCFGKLDPPRWWLLIGLILAAPVLEEALVIRFPVRHLLTPPGVPSDIQSPAFSLLGAFPFVVAGGILGVGPSIVIGYVAGLARGGWQTHSLLTPFETATLAGAIAWLLQQDYRGRFAVAMRYPVLAGLLIGASFWPLYSLSIIAYGPTSGLAALDYVTGLVLAAVSPLLTETAIGGLLAEGVRAAFPAMWQTPARVRPAPYATSLNRRLLYSLIPLTALGIGVLFWADTQIAIRVARDLVIDQMGRSATTTGWGVPFFIQTGYSLINDLSKAPELADPDPLVVENELAQGMRTVPYFSQLVYFDIRGMPAASYPVLADAEAQIRDDEADAVSLALRGVPQQVTVAPVSSGEPVQLAFVTPVRATGDRNAITGALLGRTSFTQNKYIEPFVQRLQGLIAGQGEGFLVDERSRIIFHPDSGKLMTAFVPEPSAKPLPTDIEGAQAYEDRYPDGTRRLVLYLPVSGHPWAVVVMVPHRVVLELATQISTPILVILILIGVLGLLIVLFIASRLTRPLEALAQAAGRIAAGELESPVRVAGEDEVGRLGAAFERMRESLRARLSELNLLLGVTQGVAANLTLDESLPPILQGALAATGAAGVRVVLPAPDEPFATSAAAPVAYAAGPSAPLMAPLDKDIMALTRDEGVAVIENLSRARAVLDVSAVLGRIHALLALPLKQENTHYGALWVGYTQPHTFTQSEVNFLTTLAGQATVAVVNASLFRAAESGRQRLAATLTSTPDAVIVTDNRNRLLLLNPAAESAFNLSASACAGRPVAEVLRYPALIRSLTDGVTGPNTVEVTLESGRTLYASSSTIMAGDGGMVGRVCVLRDVTHFKEVDSLKSEFVATVSHDLRAPLTLMRGYATMLPMVGPLNEKQTEFADKIMSGVEQMTGLIEDLLDLGRIEAGVGLELERIAFEEIVSSVIGSLRHQAMNSRLTLTSDVPLTLPVVMGDKTLLKQALTNLVENAIKYSHSGGEVQVRVSLNETTLVVAVSDQGVGIAPADQVRLFEKFYRVKQRDSLGIKGSGLGLAIVKSVAERHGGKAWVESRLGQGSTFFMLIPVNGRDPDRS